jgi:hypothetical protein
LRRPPGRPVDAGAFLDPIEGYNLVAIYHLGKSLKYRGQTRKRVFEAEETAFTTSSGIDHTFTNRFSLLDKRSDAPSPA